MATKNAQGQIDVVLDANGAPVQKAIDNALKRVKDIERVINSISQKSKAAADAFSNANTAKLDKMLKSIEGIEGRLQKAARGGVTNGAADQLFANRLRKTAEFNRTMKEAGNVAEAFQAKMNKLDQRMVKLGNAGKLDTGIARLRGQVENTAKAYDRMHNSVQKANAAARMGGLNVDRSGYDSAQRGLFTALKRGKNDVSAELAEVRRQANAYIAGVKAEQARVAKELSGGGAATTPPGGGGKGLFGNMGLGGVFLRTAAYGGAAAAIYGVVGAITDGVTAAIQFEDQMAKISAVAGLTATQNERLAATIREVGSNSRFATQDIAEATMVLAQAGFSAEDIKNSLKAVSNLASAAGVTFAEATDVITSAVGAFQLQASEAARITDILASALNNTKLNIQQVALGIQYAGATAYENKISFEELTAVMATMAQAGIRSGSTIGTGLRQFLTDLMTPTKKMVTEFDKLGISMKDIDVKTLGLPEVLKRLSDAGYSSASAYKTLETRSAAAYLVLKNNQDLLNKQIIAQQANGLAAQAAAKGANSLAAEWQRFKNILNESVSDGIMPTTNALQAMLKTYNDLATSVDRGKLMEKLRTTENAEEISQLRKELIAYDNALADSNEIEGQFAAALEYSSTKVNESRDALDTQNNTIESASAAVSKLILRKETLAKNTAMVAVETSSLISRFSGLAAELYGTAASYDNLVAAMQRYRNTAIQIGALKASQAAIDADRQFQTYDQKGAMYGTKLIKAGVPDQMDAQTRKAFFDFAKNPRNGTAGAVVLDYAMKNPNKLSGPLVEQLKRFVGNKASGGIALDTRENNRLDAQKYRYLNSPGGKKYLDEVDQLSGASDSTIKSKMTGYLDAANKAKTPGEKEAWMYVYNSAAAQLGSGKHPEGPEGAAKKERGGKGDREEDRRQMTIMRQRMKATEAQLANDLKAIGDYSGTVTDGEDFAVITSGKGLTKERLMKNVDKIDKSLEKWISDRWDLANAEIDSANMTGEEATLFKAEVQREIDEKKESTGRAIQEGLVKVMDAQLKVVEDIKERTEAAADHMLALAEGRLTALGRSNLRGRVPDYVTNFYERRAHASRDVRDQGQIGINQKALGALTEKRDFWQGVFDEAKGVKAIDNMGVAEERMEALDQQILELTRSNELLRASFGGESLLPASFGEALGMAIEDYKEINGLNRTFMEDVMFELPSVIAGVHQGLGTFFNDILTGTKTVQAAFGDFVKAMIQMLMQLMAKFVATQIMKLMLSAFGGPPAATGGDPLTGGSFVDFLGGDFYGGPVKGAYRGEHIKDGSPGRDSTLRRLAKGEFVMRKMAVDSIGPDYLKQMNERGAAAMRPTAVPMPAPAIQETNVYVVAPEQKPQLGKNDVLVAVQDDILKGGATKKLIRHVAQGG